MKIRYVLGFLNMMKWLWGGVVVLAACFTGKYPLLIFLFLFLIVEAVTILALLDERQDLSP